MATEQLHGSADVRAARERYVPRGIATTDFVVARADGAHVGGSVELLGRHPPTLLRRLAQRGRAHEDRPVDREGTP